MVWHVCVGQEELKQLLERLGRHMSQKLGLANAHRLGTMSLRHKVSNVCHGLSKIRSFAPLYRRPTLISESQPGIAHYCVVLQA